MNGTSILPCIYTFLDFTYLYCFQGVTRCVNEVGIGFMMSPTYHPAMQIVRPVRKKLKVKTVFNILGPMLNPARVPFAVVGVYHEDLVSTLSLFWCCRVLFMEVGVRY